MGIVFSIVAAATLANVVPSPVDNGGELAPLAFEAFPAGTITPGGWLRYQLKDTSVAAVVVPCHQCLCHHHVRPNVVADCAVVRRTPVVTQLARTKPSIRVGIRDYAVDPLGGHLEHTFVPREDGELDESS